jgi:hydrogenase maturation protein HypF
MKALAASGGRQASGTQRMNRHQRDINGAPELYARRFVVSGRVQGVGFRPFVYRIARALALNGWVRNDTGRVVIHAEGDAMNIARFERALTTKAPPLAKPHLAASSTAVAEGALDFHILSSATTEHAEVHLPPDLFCCDDCVEELRNPSTRRFCYPFTNCTQCGPRYTIIEALPYDRPNTSMAGFELCPQCRMEYEDPIDRRFHAEPLACPACGPQLAFHGDGEFHAGERALQAAIASLRRGDIVAVKGVGGFHLMCDPSNHAAVLRLRARKRRPHKPLAVMFPQTGADGLDALREYVILNGPEAHRCVDAVRPIVLARRRADCRLSPAIAPDLAELGVFLPYSPLHHLLLAEFGGPLVATSGNISGEPVITDNAEAEQRLAPVADAFLHHDRPILRPADDSVVRVIGGASRPLRIGRGVAPLEIELHRDFAQPTLAVGGHMKAAVALGWGCRAVVSPHIGELDSPRSLAVFSKVVADLQALYRVEARRVVCDAHPNYASTRWAHAQGLPVERVQHHAAHASALAGEHPEVDRWLVFAWDGVGLGNDGDLWGGETLAGAPGCWRRVAGMRRFDVIGGDRVGREPWRSAAALMWEAGHDWLPQVEHAALAKQAWGKRIGSSRTSSAGRLFDAAASLVLGLDMTSFEGQAPMMLESIAAARADSISLPLRRDNDGILRIDWAPLLPMLVDSNLAAGVRAGIFHESLARSLVEQALTLAKTEEFRAVGLTGGVFQNRLLAERVFELLAARDIPAYLPEIVPANDGGLAFGQLIEVLHTCEAR